MRKTRFQSMPYRCHSWGLLAAVAFLTWPMGAAPNSKPTPWYLKPVQRPEVPTSAGQYVNPIDAFIAAKLKEQGLQAARPADKTILLRRVYLDLIGIPPTPAEQEEFLADNSPEAYEKVVDRLLADKQYGVRFARRWLDVLRYADVDDTMAAASGIHYWRDWVITVLNEDLPYDKFVRAQLTGYRDAEYTTIDENGNRRRALPRPFDLFALGFLARGQVRRDGKDTQELPSAAVETISTAFMGLTVGCAKCHDHKFDPILRNDYYGMKALFDPLVVKRVRLASEEQTIKYDDAYSEYQEKKDAAQKQVEDLIAPYKAQLFEHLMQTLTPDVQAVFRKPEKQRTVAEQKIADDYHVVFKVMSSGLKEFMPPDLLKQYTTLQKAADAIRPPAPLPEFWAVEEDSERLKEPSYILTNGEPTQPETDKPVQPGFPFEPKGTEFRDGRRETFAEWLVAPENPLFARVAVNRLWGWHFGKGLQPNPSDFGVLGGRPSHPELLDWLASEFVARGFSMKAINKLIVMSATYRMSSAADPVTTAQDRPIDPTDKMLWQFPLLRLDAETIWDSIFSAAQSLDLKVGGKSFQIPGDEGGRGRGPQSPETEAKSNGMQRRGVYIQRGYHQSMDVMPNFLLAFDVDDGRTPCPERTRTVTAPQSLFLMNDKLVTEASAKFAERLRRETDGNISQAVDLGYRITLARPPSAKERDAALTYINGDRVQLKGFAWLLFNLDEFSYAR
jgi:Protein of unknown function (DUF1553)/Protein of unknown function (DUF1549)